MVKDVVVMHVITIQCKIHYVYANLGTLRCIRTTCLTLSDVVALSPRAFAARAV